MEPGSAQGGDAFGPRGSREEADLDLGEEWLVFEDDDEPAPAPGRARARALPSAGALAALALALALGGLWRRSVEARARDASELEKAIAERGASELEQARERARLAEERAALADAAAQSAALRADELARTLAAESARRAELELPPAPERAETGAPAAQGAQGGVARALDRASQRFFEVAGRLRSSPRGSAEPELARGRLVAAQAQRARVLVEQRRFGEAEALIVRAIQMRPGASADADAQVASAVDLYLAALVEVRGSQAALDLGLELALVAEAALGPESLVPLALMADLGRIMLDLERPDEAEALFAESLRGLQEHYGEEAAETRASLEGLVALYELEGRLGAAEALARALVAWTPGGDPHRADVERLLERIAARPRDLP